MDEYALGVLINMGLFSFLALSAYLLLIAGEMSFGQQAFFGVGAYAAGIGTAMWGLPLPLAALVAMALGAAAAWLVGLPTLRLRGLYFAMATLAAAEMFRILFELFHWQREVAGEPVGPDGTQGFRGIRWVLEQGIEQAGYAAMVFALLALALAAFFLVERSRLGATVRMVGEDPELAAVLGVNVQRVKLGVAAVAGALAALGGALYAHHNTYIEPRNFDIMLGVHSLAYGADRRPRNRARTARRGRPRHRTARIDACVPGLPDDRVRRAGRGAADRQAARPARRDGRQRHRPRVRGGAARA